MRLFVKTGFLFVVLLATGCSHFTYTPHSKRKVQKEKPSIVLLNRMIEFREEFNAWPFSKEEFVSKGLKYKEAFDGFPYLETRFRVIDNNTMTFSFYQHIDDAKRFKETQQVDLNSYGGEVKFFREKDKFIWKLKMK